MMMIVMIVIIPVCCRLAVSGAGDIVCELESVRADGGLACVVGIGLPAV